MTWLQTKTEKQHTVYEDQKCLTYLVKSAYLNFFFEEKIERKGNVDDHLIWTQFI